MNISKSFLPTTIGKKTVSIKESSHLLIDQGKLA